MKVGSSSDSLAATAMAIAGRSVRPCDVCGRERARWFCEADEAYLCEHCDGSVHDANAVSQRHERVRLAPNGTIMKNVRRLSKPEVDFQVQNCDVAVQYPPRKKPRSIRTRPETKNRIMKKESMDEIELREVPTLLEEFSGSDDSSLGFAVPNKSEPEEDLCRLTGDCNLLEEDFCDMEGFITATAVEMEELDHAFCSDGLGIDFSEIAFESQSGNRNETDTPDSVSEFDSIKVEVDEMIGFAFGAAATVKEEEEEETEHKIKLKLKLNYEDVLDAWSDRGPFWTEGPRPHTVPDCSSFDPASALDMGIVPDFCMENAQTEAVGQVPVVNFGEDRARGGGREARVMRYREKRRTRLFSKKIRYEVRKLNAERRPRLKGRFVKRTSVT